MATKGQATDQALHRKLAIDLFNLVWDLLDKEDRSIEDNDRMIQAAHASRYHWGEIGSPLELERGEWQISRVYAMLNRPQAALYHAQRCLDICRANDIGDFDIAFAYEALARAYAVAGQAEQSRKYIELGEQAAKNIKDKDDHKCTSWANWKVCLTHWQEGSICFQPSFLSLHYLRFVW